MVVHLFTREKQEELKLKKLKEQMTPQITEQVLQQIEQETNDVVMSRGLYKEILESIWYKLYMLQNYNISMDMFKGSNIRWQSIITYQTYIRAIYKGYKYKAPFPKSLLDYINGLMDSGTEPYPLPAGKKQRSVSIQELIDSKILTNYQINYIFEPVGITEEAVDTSSAWTQTTSEREQTERHNNGFYTNICTNPIQSTSKITSPKCKCALKSLFRI